MDAMDELVQLSESMRQAASLLADDDPSDEAVPRRPSTFLNAVALGNVVSPFAASSLQTLARPACPRLI
jgi:dynamin GTPase